MWIFIGLILGSLVISQHDTEEACQGRKAMLAKKKEPVYGQCVHLDQIILGAGASIITIR
jgi:hypothetical protein